MTTGERMKRRRKEIDIPVEAIAVALNVSIATVYRYENGDIEKLPGSVLEPLARVLQTTAAYLMGWDEYDAEQLSRLSYDEKEQKLLTEFKKAPSDVQDFIIKSLEAQNKQE